MGFLYSLSCVAAYKLTGSSHAREAALLAADHLAGRYQGKWPFIQAWGNVNEPSEYRLIIDCLLNLPLLYWASEVTGNPDYADKAANHIRTAIKCVMRPDCSTYHTYFINTVTGEPDHGVTHRETGTVSAWARGQAWGVYGIALSYRYLKKPEYLELFCKRLPIILSPICRKIWFRTGTSILIREVQSHVIPQLRPSPSAEFWR